MTLLSPSLNKPPEEINHIHIMGICGTGMAALAGMLQQKGFKISGSDAKVYPPMSTFLQELGIEVSSGYGPDNLKTIPDLVIVGNVITKKNPEAIALATCHIPYLSFPQALAHFFISSRDSLVITGTHGKTTTCSLLATTLHRANLDPTFMIGGIVREFESNFRLGNGKYFVAEGDEYDTAFFDKESKFLHYQPKVAVITSIEFDHADIFNDLEQIKQSFRKFITLLPEDGLLIANFDDPNVVEVVADAPCTVQSYGLSAKYNWTLQDISNASGYTSFTVIKDGSEWASEPIRIKMSGRHNCLNGLAVCAVMEAIGVPAGLTNQGLQSFGGVKRRQEVRGIIRGVTVIDDFAHHPTAVKETLKALKAGYPDKRLITIFEPRTNSSRRSIFQEDYVHSFEAADCILLREPAPIESLSSDELFSSEKLAHDLIEKKNLNAKAFATTEEILAELAEITKAGDVVAILSNGGFDDIHNRLLKQLGKEER